MGKKKDDEQPKQGGGWLTTYTDLTILLMTFFVLLLSMSVIDENRKREALNSLVGAFGLLPSGRCPAGVLKGTDVREPSPPLEPTRPLDPKLLKEITVKNNLDKDIAVTKEANKIVLRISNRVLFDTGSTRLNPEIQSYLAILAAYLRCSHYDVEIRGYCDPYRDLPETPTFHYLWVLSAKRALSVAQFLIYQGIPKTRLSAHGFSCYWPLVDSIRYPHLRYKNSRVEIIIGPRSDTIPAILVKPRPRAPHFFNYKDFLFSLFPRNDKRRGKGI